MDLGLSENVGFATNLWDFLKEKMMRWSNNPTMCKSSDQTRRVWWTFDTDWYGWYAFICVCFKQGTLKFNGLSACFPFFLFKLTINWDIRHGQIQVVTPWVTSGFASGRSYPDERCFLHQSWVRDPCGLCELRWRKKDSWRRQLVDFTSWWGGEYEKLSGSDTHHMFSLPQRKVQEVPPQESV